MFESCVKINYCIKNQKQWLIVILYFDKRDETKLKNKNKTTVRNRSKFKYVTRYYMCMFISYWCQYYRYLTVCSFQS